MDCFAVQQFIQAYVDGEFDEDDRILIVAHLQSCDACKKVAHFEQDFKMLVKHSDQPESAPPGWRIGFAAPWLPHSNPKNGCCRSCARRSRRPWRWC